MKFIPGLSYDGSGGPRSIASRTYYPKSEETAPVKTEPKAKPKKTSVKTKSKPDTKKAPATVKVVDGKPYMTDQQFADTDKTFRECCRLAGIPATARQAKKFRAMGKTPPYDKPHGAAYVMLLKLR